MAEGRRRAARIRIARVGAIGITAGVGVVLGGASPTGSTAVDAVMVVAAVALCIATIATAPWTEEWMDGSSPLLVSVALGVVVQVLARLGNIWRFGCSAAITIVPVVFVT